MRKPPEAIKVRGARTNNLRSVDVDVPLWSVVMVTGVSGSGKSSLAMGVLYAEGSRRFLDALSPYTRNRIEGKASRPVCHVTFRFPSAESFSFNSYGACPECGGIGAVDEIDESTLIPDESRSIDDGAVAPWRLAGRSFMPNVVAQLGIRTDIPYRDLTPKEQDFILHGPSQHTEVALPGRSGRTFRLNAEYVNATRAVAEAGETTRTRLGRFYTTRTCPVYHGTRFRPETLASELDGRSIAQITALELDEVRDFAAALPAKLPTELRDLARRLTGELLNGVGPLLKLGLDYLTLDRAGNTLSTGERQRIADVLAMTVDEAAQHFHAHGAIRRPLVALQEVGLGYLTLGEPTPALSGGEAQRLRLSTGLHTDQPGTVYVFDEPSVGLHPRDIQRLVGTLDGCSTRRRP